MWCGTLDHGRHRHGIHAADLTDRFAKQAAVVFIDWRGGVTLHAAMLAKAALVSSICTDVARSCESIFTVR
jgi:hypothetical protein